VCYKRPYHAPAKSTRIHNQQGQLQRCMKLQLVIQLVRHHIFCAMHSRTACVCSARPLRGLQTTGCLQGRIPVIWQRRPGCGTASHLPLEEPVVGPRVDAHAQQARQWCAQRAMHLDKGQPHVLQGPLVWRLGVHDQATRWAHGQQARVAADIWWYANQLFNSKCFFTFDHLSNVDLACKDALMMMMIAFIIIKSGWVSLIEGLCTQICYFRF